MDKRLHLDIQEFVFKAQEDRKRELDVVQVFSQLFLRVRANMDQLSLIELYCHYRLSEKQLPVRVNGIRRPDKLAIPIGPGRQIRVQGLSGRRTGIAG